MIVGVIAKDWEDYVHHEKHSTTETTPILDYEDFVDWNGAVVISREGNLNPDYKKMKKLFEPADDDAKLTNLANSVMRNKEEQYNKDYQ
jgi:hypothetical protein